RVFLGPTWQYLALADELPEPGDYKTTFLGETPVIVTRGEDGQIHAMVNRCAHRGNLVCLKQRGHAKDGLTCVYHAWRYDLTGNLTSVAFRRGVGGKGGMPDSFRLEDHGLKDPRFLESVDEIGDGITLQILSVFPNFVLQQIHNSIAVRLVLPKGPDETELQWTYIGFEDDDAVMTERRLQQANLVGPAGYVSMEDGAVGGFIQRAIPGAEEEASVIEMGGHEHAPQPTRATEASVRGFWNAWRPRMGL